MEIKFNCSNRGCQQRVSVDEAMAGQSVKCPACGTLLHVPGSTTIKFSCPAPDCGQHIVVDVSEAGRFVRCPSCGKPAQVPGDPPKPSAPVIAKKPAAATLNEQHEEPVEQEAPGPSLPPYKRLLFGWGIGMALAAVVLAGSYFRSQIVLPRHLDAMADELFAVGDFRGAPVANHQATALLYPRDIKDGGGIFLADFATRKSTLLVKQEEGGGMDFFNINMFGWSPDDHYLVLADRTNNASSSRRLAIYDVGARAVQQSFDMPGVVREVVWLNTNSLVAFVRSGDFCLVNLEADKLNSPFGGKGVVDLGARPLDPDSRRYWLTPTSDHEAAYIDQGNVWSLDVFTGKTRQLSKLNGSILEWLDYNPKTGDFLFNLSDNKKRREWLYCFNPEVKTNNGMSRVVVNDITKPGVPPTPVIRDMKGQWILGGDGVAFVKESLFVQANDGAYSTNLFSKGYVESYSVSPSRDKLYALAAFGADPLEIWEYDIVDRKLRNVVPALDTSFTASKIIPIEEKRFGGTDEKKRITYKYLPPANMDKRKRYPALVCVPHGSHWTPDSQMVANAGIFYVFVPSQSVVINASDLTPVAAQMLTAYYALLQNPNVDPNRIYIMGESHQTTDLSSLLAHDQSPWRGAVFAPPVNLPEIPADTAHFPSILISIGTGDNETSQKNVEDFTKQSFQKQIRLRVIYHKNGAHILASTDLIRERYEAIIKFILQGY